MTKAPSLRRRALVLCGLTAAAVAVARLLWMLFPPAATTAPLAADTQALLLEAAARAAPDADTVFIIDRDQLDRNVATVQRWAARNCASSVCLALPPPSHPFLSVLGSQGAATVLASDGRWAGLCRLLRGVQERLAQSSSDLAVRLFIPDARQAPALGDGGAVSGTVLGNAARVPPEAVRDSRADVLVRHMHDVRTLWDHYSSSSSTRESESESATLRVVAHVDAMFRPYEHSGLAQLLLLGRRHDGGKGSGAIRSPADMMQFLEQVWLFNNKSASSSANGAAPRVALSGFFIDCNYKRVRDLSRETVVAWLWRLCLRVSPFARRYTWEAATQQQSLLCQWFFYFTPAGAAPRVALLASVPDGMWAPDASETEMLSAQSGEAQRRPVERVVPLALLLCGEDHRVGAKEPEMLNAVYCVRRRRRRRGGIVERVERYSDMEKAKYTVGGTKNNVLLAVSLSGSAEGVSVLE